MIWLGWTSNCWASSASVFSPLTAAKATFALKAGEWFRRGRLLIVSPALRPSWPPSGRKPPLIQPVQKSRASSVPAGAVEPEHDDAIPSRPGLARKQRQQRGKERLGD